MVILPIILCFVLFLLEIPVAISMLISTFAYFVFFDQSLPIHLVVQKMVASNESFTLLAVPFFVTIGVIMNYSGISKRLMKFCDTLTGHMSGGLGHVNVLLSTLLGGISGSASADAAMQCKILVPQMDKAGYNRGFSTAVTAASSLISPIIPPGVSLIIYAVITNSSVGKMFLGGFIPGLVMCLTLIATVAIISKKEGYKPSREKRATLKEIWVSFKECVWALFMPIMIIFGLRFGFFTPTEAGAVIIFVCLFIGLFVYKELSIKDLPKILIESVIATSSIMFVIIAANVFGAYLSWERIPQVLTEMIVNFTDNKILFLLMINAFLLIMGMFLEGTALLMIATPLLFPASQAIGIDPIHFGFVMICTIAVGGITPPFGSIMYLTCTISEVSVVEFLRKGWPFIIALIASALLITFLPGLVTFLPELLM
ncbi:TRAP transporter large permease [Vallitalea okinawensis]|uniref:TRAP transporter large permease n=1 Tax=Vallitalea okinawensis TaxID=2078660 RepID=UPI000CFD160D|nr:TRAP transporter large permease [Vallitalea okinawensis]